MSFAHAKVINVEKGKCYPSFPFGYVIVGKIDKDIYEMKGVRVILGDTQKAILLTHSGGFKGKGSFQMNIKWLGTRDFETNSGFTEPFEFWEECK